MGVMDYMDNNLVCPYCGVEIQDPYEYFSRASQECVDGWCSECDKDITICRTIHVTYKVFKN